MARDTAAMSFVLNVHAEPDSVRAAFLRRALSALERISSNVPPKLLTEALSSPTDAGSLARILSQSDLVGPSVTDLDPLVPALARNVEHRQQLVVLAGGTLSTGDVGMMIGISRQAVDKRRRAGNLLAIREGSDWRYPACQFSDGEVIPGLPDVLRGFTEAGPWAALDFLLSPDSALGGETPLAVLRRGSREEVMRLVRTNQADGFA